MEGKAWRWNLGGLVARQVFRLRCTIGNSGNPSETFSRSPSSALLPFFGGRVPFPRSLLEDLVVGPPPTAASGLRLIVLFFLLGGGGGVGGG